MPRLAHHGMVRALIGVRQTLGDPVSLGLAYQRQQSLISGGADVVTHQPIASIAFKF